jgi:hypothetical protein
MMQWHVGPVPEDDFAPGPEWRQLDEPSPEELLKLAANYGAVAGCLLILGWIFLTPLLADGFRWPSVADFMLAAPAFAALVLVHELLHASLHPGWGWTRNTVIGWWPERGMFYAHYQGELSRNRLVMLALLPFLVISVFPLSLAIAFKLALPWTAGISTLNSLLACGDLYVAALLLRQLPARAIIRNRGWVSYWRPVLP